MTDLFRVLYCSRNLIAGAPDAVAAEIGTILERSRANNRRDGITGGLLFSEGCFAQVLEGPVDAVERTFERIQCDARHGAVTVLRAGPIAARDFPDWSMGFAGPVASGGRCGVRALADAISGPGSAGPGSAGSGDAGSTEAGRAVLEMLRSVVVRETEWLAPAAT